MSSQKENQQIISDDSLLRQAIPIQESAHRALDIDEITRLPVTQNQPLSLVPDATDSAQMPTITTTSNSIKKAKDAAEKKWQIPPVTLGPGATHMKTFVTKMRLDAIDYLDQQVNDWLEQHPGYQVKFATTTIGQMAGKTTEPALVMTLWL